ncbi:MAG TPA: flagellar basal body rod protein FlgB [Vicinamibacterales bacterium]|nr:flagellar basal body rod protein FlgB [Vicinamibacterales bacterium]
MGEITNDAAIMAALGRHMTRAVQRQSVAAGNLANLDTPGYRTQEAKFAESLDQELGVRVLTTTDARHIGGAAGSTGVVETGEVANLAPRRDGNNVQLDRELLSMTRAAGDFTAAQTVLAAKFRLVRYAINEGR